MSLKHYFVPHADNNYHPHIMHTKRTALYAAVCLAMKGIVWMFVLLVPSQVFLLPDVLEIERQKIIQMTNGLRVSILSEQPLLNSSAELKTRDMVANEYFDHVGPDGRNLQYFLRQVKYPYEVAGENLAMGFSTAEDVMKAWRQSRTHNANLLDADYTDIGVSIEAGQYSGIPTVYVTQHFGRPKRAIVLAQANANRVEKVLPEKITPKEEVLEVKIQKEAEPEATVLGTQIIDKQSSVSWKRDGAGTTLTARVVIEGSVANATILYGKDNMPLSLESGGGNIFVGSMYKSESPEAIFKVVTLPVLRVETANGEVIERPVSWEKILLVSQTPVEKYIKSKSTLGFLTNIFDVQKQIYAGIFAFLSVALLLNIFIEIKKQHPHVIMQTMALLLLIVVLIVA